MNRRVVSEAARFLVAGLFSYSFGISLAAILREIVGLRAEISVAASLGVLVVANFWFVRQWVFRATGRADTQFLRFLITSAATRGGEYLLFLLLLRIGGVYYLLALTISMGISTCIKFVLFRTLVFGGAATGESDRDQGPKSATGIPLHRS